MSSRRRGDKWVLHYATNPADPAEASHDGGWNANLFRFLRAAKIAASGALALQTPGRVATALRERRSLQEINLNNAGAGRLRFASQLGRVLAGLDRLHEGCLELVAWLEPGGF